MSIRAPQGTLNIPNAILRVGKLELDDASGFDTALNTIARNTILLEDLGPYDSGNKQWGLKVPNIFVATFEIQGVSAFNFMNTVNGDANTGYTLEFSGTTLTLKYDGVNLTTVTIPNLDSTYGKVYLTYEKQYFTVTIDGTRVLEYKDTTTRTPPTNGEYINFFAGESGSPRFKNLKIVNGNWITDGTSNISYVGGNVSLSEGLDVSGNVEVGTANLFVDTQTGRVGIGKTDPGAALDVVGEAKVSSNLEVGTANLFVDTTTGKVTMNETKISSNLEVGTSNLFVDTITGRVGIGKTDPGAALDVVGEAKVSSNLEVGTANLFVDTVSGNVGIGTDEPSDTLHIYGAPMVQHDTYYDTANAPGWYKIGEWSASAGARLKISFLGGNGYGASESSRGGEAILYASCNNNQNSSSIANIDGSIHAHGKPVVTQVKFEHINSSRYEFAIYAYVESYSRMSMTVECNITASFTKFFTTSSDPGAESATVSHAIFTHVVDNDGNVGIGTTNPESSLHIEGTTMEIFQTKEYHYNWGGNNVRRFTIPVYGTTSRGVYSVECEAVQVAPNGSSDRRATFKGYINNYGSGTFNAIVHEGVNVGAFHVSHIGTQNDASGTLQIDYRPSAGYQQNVNNTIFIKVRYAAATTGFGDLTPSDQGSNYDLTAPNWGGTLNLSNFVNMGYNYSISTYAGYESKANIAYKYITGIGPGTGLIYLYADYDGYDRTGSRVLTYAAGKNVTGGNMVVDVDIQSEHYPDINHFFPRIDFYAGYGALASIYLKTTGNRSDSGNVDWQITIVKLQ